MHTLGIHGPLPSLEVCTAVLGLVLPCCRGRGCDVLLFGTVAGLGQWRVACGRKPISQ